MTVGEKIRKIRKFRGISLEEMGMAIGLDEKSAANRMTQYETNYRIPRKEVLHLMAKVLNVNPINFVIDTAGTAEDIIQTLFWLEESSLGCIHLFKLARDPKRTKNSKDTAARYVEDENWPAQSPIGLWFSYGNVDVLLREWLIRQEELSNGEITEDEYFEWKLNWPWTCDNEGAHEPRVQWRIKKEAEQM
jgi:transcriptional regulator with XRE-family HTH domain